MPKFRASALVTGICGVVFLAWNNVPDQVTETDEIYIQKIIGTRHIAAPTTYDQQISTVLAVQSAVLSAAPGMEGLPMEGPREPGDLYRARSGLCYDKSRTIEKVLEYLHMKVRHVSVYSMDNGSAIMALLSEGTESHALTEVLTDKGWMAVDSLTAWIGLTRDGDPVDVADLSKPHVWSAKVHADPNPIFTEPFIRIIGLYSRHGDFYAPYIPIPDVNYAQLADNFW